MFRAECQAPWMDMICLAWRIDRPDATTFFHGATASGYDHACMAWALRAYRIPIGLEASQRSEVDKIPVRWRHGCACAHAHSEPGARAHSHGMPDVVPAGWKRLLHHRRKSARDCGAAVLWSVLLCSRLASHVGIVAYPGFYYTQSIS